jgi:hypothetical protein
MDSEQLRAKRFEEAIDRLLEVNVEGLFVGVQRINALLEDQKLKNPLTSNSIFHLGATLGTIQLLQACAPDKKGKHERQKNKGGDPGNLGGPAKV